MKKEVVMPDFVRMEEDILKYWQEKNCFEALRDKNKDNPTYVFVDGPITANYSMGIHHVWGRTLKDVFIKFRAMKGYNQKYQNGFDAHGLPVETAVEKELGINNKKAILEYGLGNFVEKCMQRVDKYAGVITEQSKRLGQWMDWENSYFTNSNENITSIWHFLKKCDHDKMLVKSGKPMMWCPRCGTSLSEHETHGNYREIEHTAVFFKAPIVGENKAILVWTTTPWTLTSNVAIAVNPENDYVEVAVKSDKRHLIVGKEAIKVLKDDVVEVVSQFKGSELINKVYETCFNQLDIQNFEHKIIPWLDVSAVEGTGAVHIAPGCGVEDFELGKLFDLPQISPINDEGIIYSEFGEFANLSVKDVREPIFESLKKQNKLYYTHNYVHSYPVCWRCKEEIVFRLIDGWFLKVEELRPRLIAAIEPVVFEPDYMKKRMLDWLNNMGDWNISRSRFYGIPLPIYPCDCGHTHVVGSLQELADLSSQQEVDALPHLHRPYIDEIKINCPKCGNKVGRIPEVGDCWLDAGITPFSTNKYFADKEYWSKNFPSDFVLEMYEQIRLWFYSMLFMSVVLEDKSPYKKVVAHESVVQEDGSKFSKSGFMIKFEDFANKLGADVARFMFASNTYTSAVRFGYNLGEDAKRKLLSFWNAYTFFNTYAILDKPEIEGFIPQLEDLDVTDKWLIARVNKFIENAEVGYSNHITSNIVKDFEKLLDELSNFYIRANRRRFWKSENAIDKKVAYWTLYHALKTIVLTMSPIIPFISEYIWQNLCREMEKDLPESIFLYDFPKPIAYDFENYIGYVELVKNIMSLGGRLRNENQLKVKQPLAKMFVLSEDKELLNVVELFQNLIRDELNVKEVVISSSVADFNDYYLTVNFKTAGSVLKGDVQRLKSYLEALDAATMSRFVEMFDEGEVDTTEFGVLTANIFVKTSKPKPEYVIAMENGLVVVLDTTISESLMEEGILREIIRNAQILRKEAEFNIEARVKLNIETQSQLIKKVVAENVEKIKQEVLASEFNEGDFDCDIEKECVVADEQLVIKLKSL